MVSSAVAASPNEIARDLADGQLNGTYSKQELENYLKNATLQGYPPGPEAPTPPVTPPGGEAPEGDQDAGVAGVQTPPSGSDSPAAGVAGEQSPLGETAQVGSLPFTGLDLGLLFAGGLLLLMLGLGARRLGGRRI